MGDCSLSVCLQTKTLNKVLDSEMKVSCLEVLPTGDVLTGQTNHYVCRWDMAGEFKGAFQTSSCETHTIQALKLENAAGLVCAGSSRAVDLFLNYCHSIVLLAK